MKISARSERQGKVCYGDTAQEEAGENTLTSRNMGFRTGTVFGTLRAIAE